MKLSFIIILLLVSNINMLFSQQLKIMYFTADRKDVMIFNWEVQSDKKSLRYIIEGSYDKSYFLSIVDFKSESKQQFVRLYSDFLFFRLKIYYTKDCYIYSDILSDIGYYQNLRPIKIVPDNGSRILYVTSIESGTLYIYKDKDIVYETSINEGHNVISHCLNSGEYKVYVYTDNNQYEIKIKVD